jgi:cell division septation protein DedD
MSGHADANLRPTFSRPLDVGEVPPEGLDLTVSATEAERQAIAAENGLERLAKLEGSFRVVPRGKGDLAATGEMRARVTQICVVTLDPFDSEIVEPIDVRFAPATVPVEAGRPAAGMASRRRRRGARLKDTAAAAVPAVEWEGEDPPDPIVDGRIDLGALAAEFLALALDPYPRKPGVEFEEPEVVADDPVGESPFSKLQTLKGILPS